jgi:hypothetical protein
MDFVEENYKGFKAILTNELKAQANISKEFYDNLVLRLLPEFQRVKSKDEITTIIRVELLNELRQDELPRPEKISGLSDKLFEHYKEINRDKRSEKLNKIHKVIGLALVIVNILTFLTMSYYKSGGFSLGPISLIIGLIIWWLPALSGFLAFRQSKTIYFSTGHFIWLIVNVGLIYLLLDDTIEIFW